MAAPVSPPPSSIPTTPPPILPPAPGSAWQPEPFPAPPPEPERPAWKIVVPIVVVLAVIVAAAIAFLGGSDDSPTAEPKASTTITINTVGSTTTTEETTTSTTEATTTTAASGDGRATVTSDAGIHWTMDQEPSVQDQQFTANGRTFPAKVWTTDGGDNAELVFMVDAQGQPYDLDAGLQGVATQFSATLGPIKDSPLAREPGRTTNLTGTIAGQPAVGWLIAGQVKGQLVIVGVFRANAQLDAIYPEFLQLVTSVSQD